MSRKYYPKAECMKDWKLDNDEYTCEFIKGNKYRVCKVEPNYYNGKSFIEIETDTNIGGKWRGDFWSGSEYFNVDEYIKANS